MPTLARGRTQRFCFTMARDRTLSFHHGQKPHSKFLFSLRFTQRFFFTMARGRTLSFSPWSEAALSVFTPWPEAVPFAGAGAIAGRLQAKRERILLMLEGLA